MLSWGRQLSVYFYDRPGKYMFLEFIIPESFKLYLSPPRWFPAGDSRYLGMSADIFYCCKLEGE